MELVWKEIPAWKLVYSGTSQALIEGELPLPEGRVAAEVLSFTGEVSVNSTKAVQGGAEIEGVVLVELICSDSSPFAFTSRAAFTHRIEAPGAEPGMEAEVLPSLQSLDIREEGGRITMSAVVDLPCRVIARAGRTLGGIKGCERVEYDGVELCTGEKKTVAAGTLRIREEIDAPFAGRVVYSQVMAQVREATSTREGILLEGTVYISALVEGRTGGLSQLLHSAPFSQTVDGEGEGRLHARITLGPYEVRAAEEFGVVVAEVQLSYQVSSRTENCFAIARDAFSPEKPFKCTHEELELCSFEGGISHRSAITEKISLPDGMPEIQRVVYCSARPLITCQGIEGGELNIEGLMAVRILYLAEGGGIFSFSEDLPFLLTLPAPDSMEAMVWAGAVAQASGAGRGAELNATLVIWGELSSQHRVSGVCGIEETVAEEPPHGLIVYFPSQGESLYSIAKRYNAPKSRIKDMCPELGEVMEGCERVMFLN